jgi:hypothetical protein
MGLALLTLTLALLAGYLAGGRAGRLTNLPLSGSHLLVAAFVVQIAEPLASRVVPGAYPIATAVSATLVVQFVARNMLVPGVVLAGFGLALNATVVLVNGAMPVSMSAAERAGISGLDLSGDVRHEVLGTATRLPWLADIIPASLPFRPEVVSAGDVLLAAGIGLFVIASMLPASVAQRRRPVTLVD